MTFSHVVEAMVVSIGVLAFGGFKGDPQAIPSARVWFEHFRESRPS